MMPQRTRIKICGFTRSEDARFAAQAGVDALGFNFVPASARYIAPEQAALIVADLPAFVVPVGLFLDAPASVVVQVLKAIPGLIPQFHGRESAAWCEQFGVPYIKAISAHVLGTGDAAVLQVAATAGSAGAAPGDYPREASPGETLVPGLYEHLAEFVRACGFLFDSHAPGGLGGTGHRFDWSALPRKAPFPLILAGGLDASHVADAIEQVRPWAVDVSSGVEQGRGLKCPRRMQQFIAAVRRADQQTADQQTGEQHHQQSQGDQPDERPDTARS